MAMELCTEWSQCSPIPKVHSTVTVTFMTGDTKWERLKTKFLRSNVYNTDLCN